MLNGVVTRSDAGRTVWINGKPYHDRSPDGLQVMTNSSSPESTEIRVRGRERPARIKVGQQLDLNAGTVGDKGSQAAATEDAATRPATDDKGAKTSPPTNR